VSVSGALQVSKDGENVYEVAVPFDGELILEDVYTTQGALLYNKSEGEVSLKGIRDGKLLVVVRTSSD
jgi:hypothetical protein